MPDVVPILLVGPVERTQLRGTAHHDHIRDADREIPIHLAALWDIGNTAVPARTRAEDIHFACARLQDPCNHLEQGAFSRAIWTNDRDALPFMKMKNNIIESSLPIVADTDMLHIEDRFVRFVMGMRVHIAYLR